MPMRPRDCEKLRANRSCERELTSNSKAKGSPLPFWRRTSFSRTQPASDRRARARRAMSRSRPDPSPAGGRPGPACYGRGGTEPTVTDADLLLGYLDPAGLAGDVAITPALARAAI